MPDVFDDSQRTLFRIVEFDRAQYAVCALSFFSMTTLLKGFSDGHKQMLFKSAAREKILQGVSELANYVCTDQTSS